MNAFIANLDKLIVNPLIVFLFALASVYFLYGVFEFIFNQENEEKKTSGKSHMLWGVIGISIMLGVWGIFSLIVNTLGISDQIQVSSPNGNVQVQLKPFNPPASR